MILSYVLAPLLPMPPLSPLSPHQAELEDAGHSEGSDGTSSGGQLPGDHAAGSGAGVILGRRGGGGEAAPAGERKRHHLLVQNSLVLFRFSVRKKTLAVLKVFGISMLVQFVRGNIGRT